MTVVLVVVTKNWKTLERKTKEGEGIGGGDRPEDETALRSNPAKDVCRGNTLTPQYNNIVARRFR